MAQACPSVFLVAFWMDGGHLERPVHRVMCLAENLLSTSAQDTGLTQCFLDGGVCFISASPPGAGALEEKVS